MIDDSALFHGGAYDPQKAHDYYMRNRKLKGRRPGAGRPAGPGRSPARQAVAVGGKPNRSKTKSRRAQLQAEKAHLEARLEHLKKVLEELVAAAKKRSGVKDHKKAPEQHHDKADRNAKEKGGKPLTQHQKHVEALDAYINDPMTGTVIADLPKQGGSSERISAELVYYWMNEYKIPYEAREWHLNQLFTLIKIHYVKTQKPKKMSQASRAQQMAEANARRKAQLGTSG